MARALSAVPLDTQRVELREGDRVRVVRILQQEDAHLVGECGDLVTIHPDASDGDFYGVRLDGGRAAGSVLFFWCEELQKVVRPAAASRGRVGVGVAVSLACDNHVHDWRRLPDSVGLFSCMAARCQWFAVCPGCLGSLDVALRVRDGVVGMALCWCPVHQQGGRDAD
jgi:hypothetical protein